MYGIKFIPPLSAEQCEFAYWSTLTDCDRPFGECVALRGVGQKTARPRKGLEPVVHCTGACDPTRRQPRAAALHFPSLTPFPEFRCRPLSKNAPPNRVDA